MFNNSNNQYRQADQSNNHNEETKQVDIPISDFAEVVYRGFRPGPVQVDNFQQQPEAHFSGGFPFGSSSFGHSGGNSGTMTMSHSSFIAGEQLTSVVPTSAAPDSGANLPPALPIHVERTSFTTSTNCLDILNALDQVLSNDSLVDCEVHSSEFFISGSVYQNSQRVSFVVSIFRRPIQDSFLVEFQRRQGDCVTFFDFYRRTTDCLASLIGDMQLKSQHSRRSMAAPPMPSSLSAPAWPPVPSGPSSEPSSGPSSGPSSSLSSPPCGIDQQSFQSLAIMATSQYVDVAREGAAVLASLSANVSNRPAFCENRDQLLVVARHLISAEDEELTRCGVSLLANTTKFSEVCDAFAVDLYPNLFNLLQMCSVRETQRQVARCLRHLSYCHQVAHFSQGRYLAIIESKCASSSDARLAASMKEVRDRIASL